MRFAPALDHPFARNPIEVTREILAQIIYFMTCLSLFVICVSSLKQYVHSASSIPVAREICPRTVLIVY